MWFNELKRKTNNLTFDESSGYSSPSTDQAQMRAHGSMPGVVAMLLWPHAPFCSPRGD